MRRKVLQYLLLLHIASSKLIIKDIFGRFSFNERYISEFIDLHLSVILVYVTEGEYVSENNYFLIQVKCEHIANPKAVWEFRMSDF